MKPKLWLANNGKGMWFGCEQPFLWGEHCVTSQKTAAEETTFSQARSIIMVKQTKNNPYTPLTAQPRHFPLRENILIYNLFIYLLYISDFCNRLWIKFLSDIVLGRNICEINWEVFFSFLSKKIPDCKRMQKPNRKRQRNRKRKMIYQMSRIMSLVL